MQSQPITSKIGEVLYRSQIVKQHLGHKIVFPSEPARDEFIKILKPKLRTTESLFRKLKKRGVKLSPYLEIGSEHCLRPTLLESKFEARGFACDISFYSLANAQRYIDLFSFKKVPKRICADAYNLPFQSNSFPFIFIYETLHHFPHPKPILKEIYRVLAPGGTLLIGADPIKQDLQISLWNRPTKLRVWEKVLKKLFILPFISHIGKTEIDHGIIETAFDLKTWQESLSIFERAQITIKAYPYGPQQTLQKSKNYWQKPKIITSIALRMFGGSLTGLCYKKGGLPKVFDKDLTSYLACPNCLKTKGEEISLKKRGENLVCLSCKSIFNKNKGVLVMLNNDLKNKILNA